MTLPKRRVQSHPASPRAALGVIVLAVYSLWYCALFSPVLFGSMVFPSDGQIAAFFTPVRLWNPLPLAGMPGVAEPHLAQLYPLRWLFAALPEAIGFNGFVVFSYALASALTFGYAHAISGSKLAAAAAGLAFGTSGYLIAHLGHTGMFPAAAWMPLTLWSLERLRHEITPGWFALGAVSVALTILGGHPQVFVYSICLCGAYAVFLGRTARCGWLRYLALYAAIVATAAALSAAHLLPAAQLADLSMRSEISFDAFKEYALRPKQLSMLLFPYLFGGPVQPAFPPYFGRWNFNEMACYAGPLTLMLAGVGALRSWRNPLGAFWIGAAIVSFLLALGDVTPLLRVTYHLPLIDKLRAPARHLQETTFALAALAALGVRELERDAAARPVALRVIAAAAAIMIATVALIAVFYDRLERAAQLQGAALPAFTANRAIWTPFAVFVLTAIALFAWVRNPASRARSAVLLLALAIDLGSFARFGEWRAGTPVANLRIPAYAVRYRDDLQRDHQRIMPMMGWVEAALAFNPVMSQHYAIPSVGGYGPLLQRRYAALSMVTNGGWINPAVLDPADRAPDLLAARYVVAPKLSSTVRGDAADGGDAARTLLADPARFQHVADVGHSAIYRNARAMPRAWLVSEVVSAAPADILRALHTSVAPDGRRYDPRALAFVEDSFTLAAGDGPADAGSVQIEVLADDRVEIRASARRDAFLVLSDVDYPGWVATVDGADATVHRTDYALRGVAVPRGEHAVVFRYRPAPFYLGLAISIAVLAGVALLLARAFAARRKAPAGEGPRHA